MGSFKFVQGDRAVDQVKQNKQDSENYHCIGRMQIKVCVHLCVGVCIRTAQKGIPQVGEIVIGTFH